MVKRVRDAREKVGSDGAVMFDAHSCLPPPIVKQFASYLQPDDLLFLEEGVGCRGNVEVMRKIRESVPVPLATGERDRTIWEVREILEAQVIDILQPDVGHGGWHHTGQEGCSTRGGTSRPDRTALHDGSYLGLTASFHLSRSRAVFPYPRRL